MPHKGHVLDRRCISKSNPIIYPNGFWILICKCLFRLVARSAGNGIVSAEPFFIKEHLPKFYTILGGLIPLNGGIHRRKIHRDLQGYFRIVKWNFFNLFPVLTGTQKSKNKE